MANIFEKLSRPGAKSAFFFIMLEYSLRLFIGFFVSAMMARTLGRSAFGNFNYVISFVLIFTPFYSMGMEEITSRDLISSPGKINEIMGTSLFLRLTGGVIGSTACFIIAYFLHHNEKTIFLFIFIYGLAMLFKTLQVVESYYLSIQDLKKLTMQRNIIFVVLSAFKLALLFFGKGWEWFVLAAAGEVILFGGVYLYSYSKDGLSVLSWKVSRELRDHYIRGSLLVFFIGLVTMGISRLDQIMIQNLAGSAALGEYAAAVKLVETWQFIPLGIVSALYPKIVKAREAGEREYQEALKQLYGIIFGGSLIFAFVTTLIGIPVTKLIYGIEYIRTGELLIAYSWTVVMSYFSVVRAKIFVIEGSLKEIALVTFLIFLINALLNYLLIPIYSSLGAVIASFASYVIGNMIYALFSRSIRKHFVLYFQSLASLPGLIRNLIKPSL